MGTLLLMGLWALPCSGLAAPAEPGARGAARNAVFAELGGSGIFYSVNYDRRLTNHVTARAGLSVWNVDVFDGEAEVQLFPVTVNYLLGGGRNRAEFGVGLVPGTVSEGRGNAFSALSGDRDEETARGNIVLGTATVGYRYQPVGRGPLLRMSFVSFLLEGEFVPWFGMSLGYGF